ncbi:MAG TPA: cystathionine beta-lyase [Desulfobacteraceae bacterium]|nr:cystathionine beta-lyase [Desulfobacteraceae bacterium]
MKKTTELIGFDNYFNVINGNPVRTINPPVYKGSTVLFQNYEDMLRANKGQYEGVSYGTDRLPTQRALEEAIRRLEGGHLTRVFQSGINGIINTLLAFTKSGDHILLCDNIYGPTARFCRKILSRYNVEIGVVPPAVGADIVEYIRGNTRLIFLESPGSNTFEIQDIPAVTAIAREKGIMTLLDNTWATPLYLHPFELGIDVVVESVTKYISGHSDVLLGSVTVSAQYAEQFSKFYRVMEVFASPEDCYLALRGLKTLEIRLKHHETSALQVARWLETVDLVDKVIHPALPSHPEHHIWKRDFKGSSGLFAFTFKEEYPETKLAAFVNSLDLFGLGYSWGGYKSLLTAAKYDRACSARYPDKTLVRLNIGLEDPGDLMKDLEKGFEALRNERGEDSV